MWVIVSMLFLGWYGSVLAKTVYYEVQILPIIGDVKTKTYRWAECPGYPLLPKAGSREFLDVAAADRAGYVPHPQCPKGTKPGKP